MSGIAGVYNKQVPKEVERMLEKIKHRGQAGFEVKALPHGTLGQRCLARSETERDRQPMNFEDIWIVFDGEIYNNRELAHDYLGDETGKTQGDRELVAQLYRKYGLGCVELLHGQFTFAIMRDQELLVTRDRLGIKPLYLGDQDGGLYFASEIKALAAITRKIYEFPAGYWYHSRKGWQAYYEVKPVTLVSKTGTEIMESIRTVLQEAVHVRLLANGPVGISLSGGLNSSILTWLASQATQPIHTFTVGMEGSEDLKAARQLAQTLGTQHHERIFTEAEALQVLPKVIYHLESFDVSLVQSAIPNYFLAELASHYVKALITGDGADELYAGYDYLSSVNQPEELQEEIIALTVALHNTSLQRADRMLMAFGLESRMPFLDVQSVALGLGLPAEWKLHSDRPGKFLLRQVFGQDISEEIANRAKQNYSKGTGLSEIIDRVANEQISDAEFQSEFDRLLGQWDYLLPNKEALYYYKILHSYYDDRWILPVMGQSRG